MSENMDNSLENFDEKTHSEDKSDNANLFNRVNLRPFEIHSNTTSANVSRRGSFMMKSMDGLSQKPTTSPAQINENVSNNDAVSMGRDLNISRNNSFL